MHSVKKSLTEYGDKLDADEKAKIEAALKDAEELLKQKDDDKEAIEAKTEALAKAAQKLGEKMYAEAQAKAQAARRRRGAAARRRRRQQGRRERRRCRVHGSQGQEVIFRRARGAQSPASRDEYLAGFERCACAATLDPAVALWQRGRRRSACAAIERSDRE